MDTFAPIQSKKEGVPQDDLPRGAALGGLRMEQVAQKTKGSATYARHPAAVPPASDETILEAQRRYFESNEINSTENNRMPAYREDDYKDRIIYPDPAERIYPYPQPQSNSEEYDSIFENSFYSAVNAPLSTFSVDVDTASYSNIRRFVDQGQLPPIDAVRIEEMINYFDYQYEKPKWGEAFSVTTKGGICPWDNSHYLVMIGLQGNVPAQNKIPPSNLVFLIDVSGSMNQSNKLPLLKESLNMMVDQLRPDQRVAIVTYSGSARLYLDSTTGADKGRIHQAIDRLTAGGATAGEAGINLAYRVAKDNFISNGNNRVILATDGDFNVGAQNDYELTELITQRRKDGIFLSVLGFGTGNYKDSKMEKIADNGNGNYHYIDSIDEGKKVLVDELGSTLFTIAKDVKIQVEFNPQQVQAYRLIGYENRSLNSEDFNNDRVDAGEIGAGHTVTALYEIIPNGAAPSAAYPTKGVDPLKYQKTKINLWENSEWMTVKLRFKEPKSNQSRLIKSIVHANDVRAYTSGDLQFASAVAEFGLLLKNSRYKGYANYDHVMEQARQSIGIDPDQHREEFIRLVDQAKQLDHRYQGYSQPQPYPMDNTYYDNNQYPTETPPMQFK
ncbi:MAG: VWA domain-containing protein [Candidatus Omnitrophica bacterium]|nr:VWA domain-containing protein [Candidatus Omnitrophota bacterium]